jgi:hypothetical protein
MGKKPSIKPRVNKTSECFSLPANMRQRLREAAEQEAAQNGLVLSLSEIVSQVLDQWLVGRGIK